MSNGNFLPADEHAPATTTDSGIPAPSDEFSLTVGPSGTDRAPRPLRRAEDAALQPRACPRARRACQGERRARLLRGDRGRHPVHQGGPLRAGRQAHADVRALLHRRRRAGLRGHGARPARLRAEVLHRGGQLRPRRQQHAGLLRARRLQVPGLHPLAEAAPRHGHALQRHAVGLLDALARERPPGDDPDVRPRHAAHLAPHERLQQPHVLVDQRRRRALLGQVPLQDGPGRARTSPTTRRRR